MLPFPTNAYNYNIQPVQYNANNPPVCFQVNGFDANYSAQLISSIANELGVRSNSNAVRMFAYNFFSSNTFNNQPFFEMVNFIGAWIMYQVRNGQNMYTIVPEAVKQGVSMVSSSLVRAFPDLVGFCDQGMMGGIQQNSEAYAALKNTLAASGLLQQQSMGSNALMQGNMGQPMQQQPMYQQQNMQMGYQAGSVTNTGMGMGGNYQHPQHVQQMQQPQANFFSANNQQVIQQPEEDLTIKSRYSSRTRANNQAPVKEAYKPHTTPYHKPVEATPVVEEVVKVYTKTDWMPSLTQPYRKLVPAGATVTFEALDGDIIETVVTNGDFLDMLDRERHQIVGGTIEVDTVTRVEEISLGINALASISSKDVEDTLEPDSDVEVETVDISEYISPKMILDTCLETAIFSAKMAFRDYGKGTNNSIYRAFATICKPINIPDTLGIFKEYPSLESIGEYLESLGKHINEEMEKANTVEQLELLGDQTAMLVRLNKFLKDVVNDYLGNKLSLGCRLTDFIVDIPNIEAYISEKFSPLYAHAYGDFSKAIAKNILSKLPDDIVGHISDVICVDSHKVSYLPISYSFTYVNALSSELDIKVDQNESLMISSLTHPWLYRIAESLFRQKADLAYYKPIYDLLITSDDVVYKLHEGQIGVSCYLISN